MKADVPGLASVLRLRSVTYCFDRARLAQFDRTGVLPAASGQAAALQTDFLAQEVE